MSRFRPGLWPTLLTLPALAILLALGVWQLQRLEWKETLIARTETQLSQAPVALPEDFPAKPPSLTVIETQPHSRVAVDGAVLRSRWQREWVTPSQWTADVPERMTREVLDAVAVFVRDSYKSARP